MRQPLLSVRWKTSIPQRRAYHRTRCLACSKQFVSTVVSSIHSMGFSSAACWDCSHTYTAHARMGAQFFRRLGGFKSSEAKRTSKTVSRSEEHTSELQSRPHLVCRLLLEKKKI